MAGRGRPKGGGHVAARSLEQATHDARRLRGALDSPDELTEEQLGATVLAYDGVLGEMCAMLDVAEHLFRARRLGEAEDERERVEQALADAGADVRV